MVASIKNLCETNIVGSRVRQRGIHAMQCEPLRARGIWSVGWASISGRYEVVRLRPDFEHLTVCAAGEGLSLIDGKWVSWREGATVLSPKNAPHGSKALPARGRDTTWELAWITFVAVPDRAPRMTHERAIMLPRQPRFLRSLIEGLDREMVLASDPVAVFHWVELIARFADRIVQRQSGDPRLAALWGRIQNRIADAWTVERMAREVGVSTAHLRRLCHAELGFGPNRQLARLRIKQASFLLSRSAMTVEEIAGAVGYADAFAFSTAFRRHTGTSPRRFRQLPRG